MATWTLSQAARAKWAREVVQGLPPAVVSAYIRELLMIANIDSPWNPMFVRGPGGVSTPVLADPMARAH